jgi:hypothetical protein
VVAVLLWKEDLEADAVPPYERGHVGDLAGGG